MTRFAVALREIETQRALMEERVERWARINSGSRNRAGIEALAADVAESLGEFGCALRRLPLPPLEEIGDDGRLLRSPVAPALEATARPGAPRRVLLVIHLDTVFAPDHPFREVERLPGASLRGPGVADAKGGLAVLLAALAALERSDVGEALGWQLILNPDEELGSPCSGGLLVRRAREADFGLVFEPALPEGDLIRRRKGSGNFQVVVRGRSAHVGRDYAAGRSAIDAAARLIGRVATLPEHMPGLIANTGWIRGGGAVNTVPDFTLLRINLRADDVAQAERAESALRDAVRELSREEGIESEIHGGFQAPPKLPDSAMERLAEQLDSAGRALGVEFQWRDSGGVCDGNRLAAAGLPTVDTLGPVGEGIHSPREVLDLDSLVPRAQLAALLLMRYAAGDFPPPREEGH